MITPMDDHEERWRRVGQAIATRIEGLGITKAELSRRAGVSDTSLTKYLAGAPIRRVDKKRGICDALGWTGDSIELVFFGGDPVEVEMADLQRRLYVARSVGDVDTVEAVQREAGARPLRQDLGTFDLMHLLDDLALRVRSVEERLATLEGHDGRDEAAALLAEAATAADAERSRRRGRSSAATSPEAHEAPVPDPRADPR